MNLLPRSLPPPPPEGAFSALGADRRAPDRKRLVLLLYALTVLAGVALCRAYGFDIVAALAATRSGLPASAAGHALVAALFALVLGLSVFLSLPANPLFYLFAGYCFGAAEGTLLAALGNTLGATAAYRFFGATLPAATRLRLNNPFPTLLLLRVSPWFPAPLITLICSTAGIAPRMFFVTTLFGSVPLILVYALVASRLAGPLDASVLQSGELLLASGVFGALSLAALLEPLRLARRLLAELTAGQPASLAQLAALARLDRA